MIALPIRGRDAAAQLARALLSSAREGTLAATVEELAARPWASATYVGTQVTLTFAAPRAPTLGRWIAELPQAELPMPGCLLASLAVDGIVDDGEVVRATLTGLVIDR